MSKIIIYHFIITFLIWNVVLESNVIYMIVDLSILDSNFWAKGFFNVVEKNYFYNPLTFAFIV